MKYNNIAIIIPAYEPNEQLPEFIKQLSKDFKRIVVVDDGSSGNNKYIFDDLNEISTDVKILRHDKNLGKGNALKTAFAFILDQGDDISGIITADADGQHRVEDCLECAQKLQENMNEKVLVLGSRNWTKAAEAIPLRSRFGNLLTAFLVKNLFHMPVTDTQTGLRGIPRVLIADLLEVKGERYEYEMNMLMWCNKNGIRFVEVPIQIIYQNNNESSHFKPVQDSLRIYSTFIKYSISSLMSVGIDYLFFILASLITDNIWIMVATGRVTSAGINFYVNKKVVFKNSEKMGWQIAKYLFLVCFSGMITGSALKILTSLTGCNIILLKIIVETAMYFFNYKVQKWIVFKNAK